MCTEHRKKINALFFLCILLSVWATETTARTDYSNRDPNRPSADSSEMTIIRNLGLSEDVNDSAIIKLLDKPDRRRNEVILLIRYRRISSATPKLLQLFNDDTTNVFTKIEAAEALCDFGNKEWMPTIKKLSTDPNGFISGTPLQIDTAGLLARAGDFSQFDVIEKNLADKRDFIRHEAMFELGNFAHPTDPVTDKAAELLTNFAKGEPNLKFREYAIERLEKLAKVKPALKEKVIEALEANVNSTDENLRTICKVKLTAVYKKPPAEPNQ